MSTKTKIKITDNIELREKIDKLYEKTSLENLSKWSLIIAKHILTLADIDYKSIDAIVDGIIINQLWQSGKASVNEVRQTCFKIHKIARQSEGEINKTAFRVVAQALSCAHMREHAMVASDYAIKVICLMSNNDIEAIKNERDWQLNELINLNKVQ